jgi:type VI secretion system protein ImpH
MAVEDRKTIPPLIQSLLEEPHFFSFFQAVHLLERYVSSVREAKQVGYQGPVESEVIRFKADVSMAFPLSDIVAIEEAARDNEHSPLFRMTTSFLGLYGPSSPLPDFYTEDILQEDSEESYVEEFLDVFHHRLLSLFYRCWLKYRYYMQFVSGGEDEFSQRAFALIGLGTDDLKEALHIPPVRLLRYAGLFAQQSRSASGLESLLSDYFGGLSIHIEQCIDRWVAIGEEDRAVLGIRNSEIAGNAVMGEKILDRASKFRISIGLTKFADFIRFLPDGEHFQALREITLLFLHAPLEFEEELILPGEEVPMPCLASLDGPQLGRTSWLISNQPDDNVSVIFQTE